MVLLLSAILESREIEIYDTKIMKRQTFFYIIFVYSLSEHLIGSIELLDSILIFFVQCLGKKNK